MKAALVAHYLDESVGHGMDRYSYKLWQGLKAKGMDISTVSCPPVFLGPLKSLFDFFFLIPLKMLISSGDVFHLLVPQAGVILPLFRFIRRKKVVTTIYDLNPIIYKNRNPAFHLIALALSSAIKNSDLLLAISSQTKKDIIDHFEIDPEKIHITLLGVDEKFKPIKRPKNEIFTVGYIGGFAGNKNVPFLIRAYALFESGLRSAGSMTRLVLYGKGAEYDYCRKLASSLGIKNIEFRGFAPEERIVEIYNSFDVFVFPSEIEGFGLPIVESRMCRVPTIVKAGSHVPEEVTRFCLEADDEPHLARLLQEVEEKGFEFSKEHLQHLENFRWENCIERTAEAYRELG